MRWPWRRKREREWAEPRRPSFLAQYLLNEMLLSAMAAPEGDTVRCVLVNDEGAIPTRRGDGPPYPIIHNGETLHIEGDGSWTVGSLSSVDELTAP